MSEAYERGAIVVVAADRPTPDSPAGDLVERLGRRRGPGEPLVVGVGAEALAALLTDPSLGTLLVDLRGSEEDWGRLRPSLVNPRPAMTDDVPLLVVADGASWPRVLEVLDTGRGDGLQLPAGDAELWARIRGVSAARQARESERDRLAQAIHDDSLQVLAAVAMRLQLLRRRAAQPEDHPVGVHAHEAEDVLALDEVIDDLGDALERLRTLEVERRGIEEPEVVAGTGSERLARSAHSPVGPAPASSARPPAPATEPTLWGSPEVLSRLSHDLRSPLNAVLGFAQLLELGDLDADQSDAVRQIIRAGTRLLELINEVVDLSRIEAGYLDLSLEPVGVGEVVRDALDLMRPAASEAAVELVAPPSDATIEVAVMADRQRLVQVLLILVSNAVRYNEPGGHVAIEVTRGDGHIRLAVRDDGIGIDPERLPNVFVPFDRLGVERQGLSGTGLGLAIAKGLVAHMGGHLAVDSAVGEGSSFWFELRGAPVPPSEAEIDAVAGAEGVPAGLAPFEVLYIEDNPTSLRLVERVLARRPGVTMIPAMQGRLGVQLAAQRQPAMVLVDLHLPDMAGREVVRVLTTDPVTAHIPVVVLSANAVRPRDQAAVVEGARAYLSKPFQIDSLLTLVDTIRAEWASAAAPPDRVEEAGTTSMSTSDESRELRS
jgi:CheY-like chemotaxis protein